MAFPPPPALSQTKVSCVFGGHFLGQLWPLKKKTKQNKQEQKKKTKKQKKNKQTNKQSETRRLGDSL